MRMLMTNFPQKMVCMLLFVSCMHVAGGLGIILEKDSHLKTVSIILSCNDYLKLKCRGSNLGGAYYKIRLLGLTNNDCYTSLSDIE